VTEAPEPSRLRLASAYGVIELVDEIEMNFGRAPDPSRLYLRKVILGGGGPSCLGILIDNKPLLEIAAPGGATTVHSQSAFVREDRLYCAVGQYAACLALNGLGLEWAILVDTATCFGLYPIADAIISRGEFEISRLSFDGELVWQTSGRDIFTGAFSLEPDWIAARDWNDDLYRIAYNGTVLEAPH
jgi:hypothetical protein